MDCLICRYGELALKGKNRGVFESRLVSNMRDCLKRHKIEAKIQKVPGRIFVFTSDSSAASCLKRVFGLVSISPAVIADADIDSIKKKIADYVSALKPKNGSSFRITAKRPDKSFKIPSRDIAIQLGSFVEKEFSLKVDLDHPDIDINVEVIGNAFIFHKFVDCFGGLPLGMEGKVACLIEKERDLAAAWLMMRRGCVAVPVFFKDVDVSLLANYDYGFSVRPVKILSFDDVNKVIESDKCSAFVVGDILDDFDPSRYSEVKSVVLQPLIYYSKDDVELLLEGMG